MGTWDRLTVTRGRWEGDNGGKKGKGLVKKHVWMTHGHGQQTLWGLALGVGSGLGRGGQRENNWDTCNRITIKIKIRKWKKDRKERKRKNRKKAKQAWRKKEMLPLNFGIKSLTYSDGYNFSQLYSLRMITHGNTLHWLAEASMTKPICWQEG